MFYTEGWIAVAGLWHSILKLTIFTSPATHFTITCNYLCLCSDHTTSIFYVLTVLLYVGFLPFSLLLVGSCSLSFCRSTPTANEVYWWTCCGNISPHSLTVRSNEIIETDELLCRLNKSSMDIVCCNELRWFHRRITTALHRSSVTTVDAIGLHIPISIFSFVIRNGKLFLSCGFFSKVLLFQNWQLSHSIISPEAIAESKSRFCHEKERKNADM